MGCPICSGSVRQRHGRGPMPVYCSPLCRRRAERQRLKRLQHLGAAVEAALREQL